MFASRITKDVPLPSDPSVLVTIKKLNWLSRKAAQQASQREAAKGLVEMGGAAFLREMEALAADKKEANEEARKDPYLTHDPLTVLVNGVKAWTASEPVNKETLSDLDEADAEFLAREILALSIPTRTEDEAKNAA